MSEIKVGDIVKLKSGGPDMCVNDFYRNRDAHGKPLDFAECHWFAGGSDLKKGIINVDCLTGSDTAAKAKQTLDEELSCIRTTQGIIQAIRMCRQRLGLTLKEAKDYVEAL